MKKPKNKPTNVSSKGNAGSAVDPTGGGKGKPGFKKQAKPAKSTSATA
ncbi:MAG TPA: hypothetical protein VH157_06425 [Bryobacteraceae bacterium]|jgi:hypothetical protein|nr:hypothetical protein [Bryobacteraceae bacterium]